MAFKLTNEEKKTILEDLIKESLTKAYVAEVLELREPGSPSPEHFESRYRNELKQLEKEHEKVTRVP